MGDFPLAVGVGLICALLSALGTNLAVAAVAFALHAAAQAVLAGGLVFLAVLAERFFGFELGRRQWIGIGRVAVSLSLLTLAGGGGRGGANSRYSLAG